MGNTIRALSVITIFLSLALASDACFAVSDCVYLGGNFSDGAVACQTGRQVRCSNGAWKDLDLACVNPPTQPAVVNPVDCKCTEAELASCDQLKQACCVSMESGTCIKRCCDMQ